MPWNINRQDFAPPVTVSGAPDRNKKQGDWLEQGLKSSPYEKVKVHILIPDKKNLLTKNEDRGEGPRGRERGFARYRPGGSHPSGELEARPVDGEAQNQELHSVQQESKPGAAGTRISSTSRLWVTSPSIRQALSGR